MNIFHHFLSQIMLLVYVEEEQIFFSQTGLLLERRGRQGA